MGFKNFLSIFLLIVILHIATTSGKKQRKNGNSEELPVTKTGDNAGLSSELQQLRELASKESGSIILEPQPKHGRRKNKHHHSRRRRPHHKKNRTRPLDILKAEDDTKSTVNKHSETGVDNIHGHNDGKSQRQTTRTRGSRHLDLDMGKIHRGKHHHQHRRLRAHHNGHNSISHHGGAEQPILHQKPKP